MYTLTRRLSVVCLTVVLSLLVYGCGGSSKQALITTDVITDMVMGDLTPDVGTYTIQPDGTANAGDVAFGCEGEPCIVTVADDGSVTSTGGMVTAMISASAAARLLAEDERDAANMALEIAEGERDTANMNLETAEGERDTANMNLETAEGERDTANMNLATAEGERDTANMNLATAEGERDTANMNLETTEGDLESLRNESDDL